MSKPKKRSGKRKISPEMITAISAVFIGICAIGISLYETSLIRQAQKGTVWPFLGGGYSYNADGFSYLMENAGVGPAKIKYIIFTVDGEPIEDWSQYFQKLDLSMQRADFFSQIRLVFVIHRGATEVKEQVIGDL
jgi:hypothetical protein